MTMSPAPARKAFQDILAPCYRLRPSVPLNFEAEDIVRALAGPRIFRKGRWGGTIQAPDNVAWLVEKLFADAEVGLEVAEEPRYRPETDWWTIDRSLRQRGEVTDEALDMTFEYQRDAVVFGVNRGNVHLWHAGGSGKTLSMLLILLFLLPPLAPLVVVTKAGVRGQWQAAIQRFAPEIESFVMQPQEFVTDIPEGSRWMLSIPGLGAKTITKLWIEAGVRSMEDLKRVIASGELKKVKGFGWKSALRIQEALTKKPREVPEALNDYINRMRSTRARPVVIVGWTSLRESHERLAKILGGFGGIIYDEIHVAKQSKRQRVKVKVDGDNEYLDLKNLSSSASKLTRAAKYRIGGSGTPIKDRLRDLWGQLDLIEPGAWGTSSTWMKRYCAATEGEFGGLITTGFASEYFEELEQRLSFCVHRVDYEVSHAALVGLIRRESWRLGPDELGPGWDPAKLRAELKAARDSHSALLEVQIASAAASLREPLVERIQSDIEANPRAKICCLDIRHDNVDKLAEALREGLEGVEVLAVHGGNTNPEKREKIRRYYMEHEGPLVLVATGESVGTGYDLHDTDLAYLAALPWNPGELHQWTQRFSRHGQKRPVRLIFCIPQGSVIEVIASRDLAKMPAVEKIVRDQVSIAAMDVLGGTDDKEKLAKEILTVMGSIDADLLED